MNPPADKLLFTTSTSNHINNMDTMPNTRNQQPRDFSADFINSKEFAPPPIRTIAVVQRRRFLAGVPTNGKKKVASDEQQQQEESSSATCLIGLSKWSSGRSLASSITYSSEKDFDDDEDDYDDEDLMNDMVVPPTAAFSGTNFWCRQQLEIMADCKPFIPKRQESVPKELALDQSSHHKQDQDGNNNDKNEQPQQQQQPVSCKDPSPRSVSRSVIDSPPQKPRRSLSFASDVSSAGDNADNDGDEEDKEFQKAAKQAARKLWKKADNPHPLSDLKLPFPVDDAPQEEEPQVDMEDLASKAVRFHAIVTVKDDGHERCFAGSDAVDQMLAAGMASSRTEAVMLARSMMKHFSLFHPVVTTGGKHNSLFKDRDNLFYRCSWDKAETMEEKEQLSRLENDNNC